MKIKMLRIILLNIVILVLFSHSAKAEEATAQQIKPLKGFKDDRTVTERTDDGLKYLIRKKRLNEAWYDYFCNVLLSLGEERGRLDFGFQSLQKDKIKLEFIPFTVFDVEGIGLIVPVKTILINEAMKEIHLRPRPGRAEVFDLMPVSFAQRKCEANDIYFLIYARPPAGIRQINIDFPRLKAGCVAIIRNEEAAREYYRPVRSFAEIAADILADTRNDADRAAEKAKKEKCINAVHKIAGIKVNPQEASLKFIVRLKSGAEDGMYNIKTEFLEGEEVYNIKSKLAAGQKEFQYYVPYEKIPKVISLSALARKRNFTEKFAAWVRLSRELNESEKELNIYDAALASVDTVLFSIEQ